MPTLHVNLDRRLSRIAPEIYGHFSEHLGRCIYEGLFVGEDSEIPNVNGMRSDVVEALREIRVPVLRWPGGCFADEYHWRDGIGPRSERKRMVNTHWGGVVEDNSFGTHEFMELCAQIGCEPYVNGNVGSGTVQEMADWVEYMTFDGDSPMARLRAENGREEPWRLKYFGVGNENWGCGGNMRPEYYADLYRRYQTYTRNYGDNRLYKIACGPSDGNTDWTERVMEIAGRYMHGLTMHYYTVPDSWENKGSATGFGRDAWYQVLKRTRVMEDHIRAHLAVMDRYDPQGRVGLIVDEWGTWYAVEEGTNPGFLYQQNTTRDALVASINFDIFNKHSDRVVMANIAQLVNVLQAVILTDGARMLRTPTWHVFDLYKHHQGATLLESHIDTRMVGEDTDWAVPDLSESCSIDEEGGVTLTLSNLGAEEARAISVQLTGEGSEGFTKLVEARILRGDAKALDRHNTFDRPDEVASEDYSDQVELQLAEGRLETELPAASVLLLRLA